MNIGMGKVECSLLNRCANYFGCNQLSHSYGIV